LYERKRAANESLRRDVQHHSAITSTTHSRV
jgi:hypothetical protein